MKILVTGIAGFIGSHTADALLKRGDEVVGIDNFNDYYDPKIKEDRVKRLKKSYKFSPYREDISNYKAIDGIIKKERPDKICHLAAQAGVRHSLENPFLYLKSNIDGTLVMLETARHNKIKDFIYASSSSVYGGNKKVPFSEEDRVDTPISLYATTKKANELMAHTYHKLFGLNTTGLRFFTVYGPYGRPDMALFIFTKNILEGQPIEIFNHGKMKRDFTYVDDIVSGIVASLDKSYPCEIFNLGNSNTVDLMYFIERIEKELGKKAIKKMMPMQKGDVAETFADISKAQKMLGFRPKTSVDEGIKKFINWYKKYYNVK